MREKFTKHNNKRKLVMLATIAIVAMLYVGIMFKILGLSDFVIDANVDNTLEFSDKATYFINTLLLWFNFGFFLFYSAKEYSLRVIAAWVCSFPILYACNSCDFLYGILVTSIVPAFLILMIKFEFSTIKRLGLIYLVTGVYQLISQFVKTTVFSINPIITNGNVFYTFIYSIDLYIFLVVFILFDATEKKGGG